MLQSALPMAVTRLVEDLEVSPLFRRRVLVAAAEVTEVVIVWLGGSTDRRRTKLVATDKSPSVGHYCFVAVSVIREPAEAE